MFRRNVIPVWVGILVLSGMFLMGQEGWGPGARVSVRIAHQEDGYYLDLIANEEYGVITSGTVSGPNIGTLSLAEWCTELGCSWFANPFFGQTKPTPGDTYTFNLNYSNRPSETLTDSVYDIGVGFPVPVSPADGETVDTLTPTFSWEPPAWGCANWYHLLVWDSADNAIWWPHIPAGTTSVVYDFDGSAVQPLQSSESYYWGVNAFDDCAELNDGHDNFAGASGGTFTVQ